MVVSIRDIAKILATLLTLSPPFFNYFSYRMYKREKEEIVTNMDEIILRINYILVNARILTLQSDRNRREKL